jgi:MFS family permease
MAVFPSTRALAPKTTAPARLLGGRKGVVFASTIAAAMGLPQTFLGVFGIVMVPISQEFRWSRTLVSGVMGLTVVKTLALVLAVGWLLDRFGPRRVLLVALCGYVGALSLFAIAPRHVVAFYTLFSLVCLFGAPIGGTTLAKALAGWFDAARGAAIGSSVGFGTAVGSALFPIVAAGLLSAYGWRGVFVGVAALVGLIGIPSVYFCFRDPPPATAPTPAVAGTAAPSAGHTLAEALRTPTFWYLVVSIATGAGFMTAMFSQVVPVAQSNGFTLRQAVAAMTVFASVCAVAQGLVGALLDRFSRPLILIPFYLIGTLGLWLMQHSSGPTMLLVSTALMGVSIGAEYSALPVLLSRYFGIAHFGKIACIVYGVVTLISGAVPIGMNAVFDATGSYALAVTAVQIAVLSATGLILLLPPYGVAPRADDRLGEALAGQR